MDSRRRAQYRVTIDEAAGLVVTVHEPGGLPFVGRLVDAGGSGVGVRFLPPNWPNLTVGQEVDLVFSSEKLDEPFAVAAQVRHRAEEEGIRRYGFRFLQAQELDAFLPLDFRQYFNRRRLVRVSPTPYYLVTVTLAADPEATPVEARLENISATGAAVSIEAELETAFTKTTRVGISMQLPKRRCSVDLIGNIRYRRLVGPRIYYGIEFDSQLSKDFARQQEIIGKFVTQREQQSLRKSA